MLSGAKVGGLGAVVQHSQAASRGSLDLTSTTLSTQRSRGSLDLSTRSTVTGCRPIAGGVDDGYCQVGDNGCEIPDPEARFRKYGKHFGGSYTLDTGSRQWWDRAPHVTKRTLQDRQFDQLLELAALNERLAGEAAHEIRKRTEYLKANIANQEAVYKYVTQSDATATLKLIEEANSKVSGLLDPEYQDQVGVGELRMQLQGLQEEIYKAHEKLHLTQARVEQNLSRVDELRKEASQLASLNQQTATEPATATATAGPSEMNAQDTQVLSRRIMRRQKGLRSGMEIEDELREFWYPVCFASKLKEGDIKQITIFDKPWAVYRDENGQPACLKDECAHRACPLSLGQVVDGHIQCAYHGWEFNTEGSCTKMPSTVFCKNIGVPALTCVESDGLVWVWAGDGPPSELPTYSTPPNGFYIHAEIELEVPVEHGLLMENLLDLAHAPFTHTSTFAKGWPIPDAVRFHTQKLLGGRWDPYPIDMAFQPPCMVLSTIGLMQPGKISHGARASECTNHLFQLHVCLPSKVGHTRLLYRMALDFMPWVRFVPGMHKVWENVANQVLGEDLVLVLGQQERLMAGGDTWANPVPYDKLAVRYRRWRNSLAEGQFVGREHEARKRVEMDAADIFVHEEDASGKPIGSDV